MKNKSLKPKWLKFVSVGAVVWNALGVSSYLDQAFMSKTDIAKLSINEQALFTDIPSWVTFAFATAVFFGLLGSFALLFKKKISHILFLISFVGILVQMYNNIFISGSMDVYGSGSIVMPLLVLMIGFYLLLLSKRGVKYGWLN